MAIRNGARIAPPFTLLTAEKAEQEAQDAWNPSEKPPVSEWLSVSQVSGDRQRLGCLGNIVFPRQARLAMHWLLRQHVENS